MNSNIVRKEDNTLSYKAYNEFVDSLLDSFFGRTRKDILSFGSNMPKINVRETDDEYVLEVAVSGLNKDNLDVEVLENTITISYDDTSDENREGKWLCREISRRSFKRSFSLAEEIDVEKITSACTDGLLGIILPKLKTTKKGPTKIKIE